MSKIRLLFVFRCDAESIFDERFFLIFLYNILFSLSESSIIFLFFYKFCEVS